MNYTGLNYYQKLNNLVQVCVNSANTNPFVEHYFICDDVKFTQSIFFKYTSHLVNINVLTFSQYLNFIQNKYHFTNKRVLSDLELMYIIFKITHDESFNVIEAPSMSFVKELASLMRQYDKENIQYDLSINKKLDDFNHLYNSVFNHLDDSTFLSKERMLLEAINNEKDHIYFIDGDHLTSRLQKQILDTLSKNNTTHFMYSVSDDDRLLNQPYVYVKMENEVEDNFVSSNLFKASVTKSGQSLYKLVAPTTNEEVKKVGCYIKQFVVDEGLRYKDVMIIYPDDTYKQLIIDTFKTLEIPNDLVIDVNNCFNYSHRLLRNHIQTTFLQSLSELCHYHHPKFDVSSYKDYFKFIENFNHPMSNKEILDFFDLTCTMVEHQSNKGEDVVHVASFDNAYGYDYQYVFYLGLNETVCPSVVKDTGLLLDEDIEVLSQYTDVPSVSITRQGLHESNVLKAFLIKSKYKVISYALTTLSNDTLLPSTLYKQLEKMYELTDLPTLKFKSLDQFYLLGGQKENESKLNEMIKHYQSSHHTMEILDTDTVLNLYPKDKSVSQLETYNKCPLSYFYNYGLSLKKPFEKSLMSNEIGTIVHEVLENCVGSDLSVEDAINNFFTRDENKEVQVKLEADPINKYFLDNIKIDLPIIIDILKQFSDLSLFNVADKEKPVEGNVAGIPFRGYVDRIDTHENSFLVIDYKSSAKDIDFNLAMQGYNIQMLLYMSALSKQLESNPAGVLYFTFKKRMIETKKSIFEDIDNEEILKQYKYAGMALEESIRQIDITDKLDTLSMNYVKKTDTYKGNVLNKHSLDILMNKIEEHIQSLYENMLEGIISITPLGSEKENDHSHINPCRYCDYNHVCAFDHFYNDFNNIQYLDVDTILEKE